MPFSSRPLAIPDADTADSADPIPSTTTTPPPSYHSSTTITPHNSRIPDSSPRGNLSGLESLILDSHSDNETLPFPKSTMNINVSTTITGNNNLLTIPPLDVDRIVNIIVAALAGIPRDQKTELNIEAGTTIQGDYNVVGTGLGFPGVAPNGFGVGMGLGVGAGVAGNGQVPRRWNHGRGTAPGQPANVGGGEGSQQVHQGQNPHFHHYGQHHGQVPNQQHQQQANECRMARVVTNGNVTANGTQAAHVCRAANPVSGGGGVQRACQRNTNECKRKADSDAETPPGLKRERPPGS